MKKRILKSILSGVLLSLSWPEIGGLFPLIFVAFIPLLLVEDEVYSKRYRGGKVYRNAYVAFFVFNLITTWWIWHASPGGAVMAVVFNSALMALPIWLFHLTRRYAGNRQGYVAFIAYMLAFEWLHHRWELSWPWLSTGNVFANQTWLVQWYEYTGVVGGTLWVLLINLILYQFVKYVIKETPTDSPQKKGFSQAFSQYLFRLRHLPKALTNQLKLTFILGVVLLLPILWSFWLGFNVDLGKNNKKIEVVLSQPNVDPYKKFDDISSLAQVNKLLEVTKENLTENTRLIIAPETAIPSQLEEATLNYSPEAKAIQSFLINHPNTSLLTGISSYAYYNTKQSRASRPTNDGRFYEFYNSALLIDKNLRYDIYHKSELVLGVERLPAAYLLKYVEDWFDLGGTSGTLGVANEPKLFYVDQAKIAPTICYESIYGETTAKFSRRGANLIAISTNDAWWYDTPGYKQLLAYAKLRAIENRKWIARSANTGISCFINPKGEITDKTKWEETTSLKKEVPLIEGQTFYVVYGDFLGRISLLLGGLLLVLTLSRKLKGN